MRRIAALIAMFCLLTVPMVFADDDEPNQVCDAAKIGFYLPDDTQTTVDTGTWIAVSDSDGLVVMVDKNDTVLSNSDLTDKNLAKACSFQDVKNYKFVDSFSDNGLVFLYGTGTYKNKAGKSYDGFFGLLNNSDVKKTTFFVAFLVPSLKDKAVYKRVLNMVENVVPMQ